MAQKKTTRKKSSGKTSKQNKNIMSEKLQKEIMMIGTFVLAIIIAVSVYTENGVGILGQFVKSVIVGTFGLSAYLLPVYIITLTGLILFNKLNERLQIKYILTAVFLVVLSSMAHILSIQQNVIIAGDFAHYYNNASYLTGGVVGGLLGDMMVNFLGSVGSIIILLALALIYLMLLTERSFFKILAVVIEKVKGFMAKQVVDSKEKKEEKKVLKKNRDVVVKGIENEEKESKAKVQEIKQPIKVSEIQEEPEGLPMPVPLDYNQQTIPEEEQVIPFPKQAQPKEKAKGPIEPADITIKTTESLYEFPPATLLKKAPRSASMDSRNTLLDNAKKLESALESFGVKASVVQVNKGPTVTRYELQPGEGVKVSKIANLADDIALNLAADAVRIEAPVPGKGVVGIEVANKDKQMVYFREVVDSLKFSKFPSDVAFGLGKDIDGNVIVTDISKMPHLLVAGATGSGKSVCINTLITSILYKAHPKDVKLLLIDPKVVELSVYNGIPHLLIPVVNDPKKAASALNWAVSEMTTRYKKFAEYGVRDVKGFNNMVDTTPDCQQEKMPHIVVIIDELADLMMVSPKDVEEAICRLAQMARAAGIHLVIATQRPSVDVITGVIKANIPSRLAFAVSSGTDSRTILDMNGAEKLLGKGDMLFMPIGASKPIRIQGAFVSDKEVESIVDFVKKDAEVEYQEEVLEEISAGVASTDSPGVDQDEHLEQAAQLVVEKQKASISMLQRTYRIGFNRASRLMDQLHQKGIVGPEEGSKPRKVLISKEQFEAAQQQQQEQE